MFADRHPTLLAALGCAAVALLAGPARAEPAVSSLAPGGQLVVVEDHRVPVIRIEAAYPVGSLSSWWQDFHLDDYWPLLVVGPDGPERPDLLDLDFWVGETHCGWSALVLPSDLDAAMDAMAADLKGGFGKLRIEDGDVVKRRWKVGRHSPGAVLERTAAELFFQRHDVRRRAAHKPHGLVWDAGQMVEIRDGILSLDGWVLGVAGDITPQAAAEAAQRLTEALPKARYQHPFWSQPGGLPLQEPQTQEQPVDRRVTGSHEALLAWARPGLEADDPAARAARLADGVVQRRLRHVLRDERGDTYAVSSQGLLAKAAQPYLIVVPVAPWSVEELGARVVDELTRLAQEGFTREEVERVRHLQEAEDAARLRRPTDRLRADMTSTLTASRQAGSPASEPTFEQVDRFAREFYAPAAMQLIRVLPRERTER